MKRKKMFTILVLALSLMICSARVSGQIPLGTAFTYQGWLMDNKKPADDFYDFQFRLYDANVGGTQQESTIDVNDLEVTDGYFTVQLDFGNVFDGNERWLETTVAQADGSDPCTLNPRLEVTLSPYAIYAKTAGAVPEAIADAIVPTGGIIMWSGLISNIPTGWALCDGTNGTPNLTSRFIRSVPNASTDPGSTGGSSTHTHGAGSYSAASHTHTYSGTTNVYNWNMRREGDQWDSGMTGSHSHTYSGTTNSGGGGSITGVSATASSLPPYYELAFIMKL